MTQIQMIHSPHSTKNDKLYIALELSNTKWKIAFGNGFKVRMKTISARDRCQFEVEVEKAKKHFKMPEVLPHIAVMKPVGMVSGSTDILSVLVSTISWSTPQALKSIAVLAGQRRIASMQAN